MVPFHQWLIVWDDLFAKNIPEHNFRGVQRHALRRLDISKIIRHRKWFDDHDAETAQTRGMVKLSCCTHTLNRVENNKKLMRLTIEKVI